MPPTIPALVSAIFTSAFTWDQVGGFGGLLLGGLIFVVTAVMVVFVVEALWGDDYNDVSHYPDDGYFDED